MASCVARQDPSVKAIEWRLIVLESIAGVPGFVAAGIRHFRSLRTLQRDHGWIATLLEEAENERMHLLLCLNMFEANIVTRAVVIAAQMVMVPALFTVYCIHPPAMHRFVGYLEETACKTYVNVIHHVETPGTKLHTAWATLDAPVLGKGYYKVRARGYRPHMSVVVTSSFTHVWLCIFFVQLPNDAKWVDTLKCMMADETHHRDVNHTFADMKSDDPNPFLEMVRLDIGVVSCAHSHVSPIAPVATWPPAQERRHQGVAPRVGGTTALHASCPLPPPSLRADPCPGLAVCPFPAILA